MQPSHVFEEASLFRLILEKIDTLQTLSILSQTCKLANKLLNTKPCDEQWMHAAKKICGPAYWKDATLPGQPHTDDRRYTAMLRICPWLSVPREIRPKFMNRINATSDRIAQVYFIQQTRTILCAGLELGIRNTDIYDYGNSNEQFHSLLTNPRPFGKKFEIEIDTKQGTQAMSLEELTILEQVKCLPIPLAYTLHSELSRATMIHDGAVAVQLEGNGMVGTYVIRLLIFARYPTLRLIHYLHVPSDLLVENSYSFGLGEMWASGLKHTDDVCELYYLGPRRDKRIQPTKHFAVASSAFWAASSGNVIKAVHILRSKNLPLTFRCPLTGYNILQFATNANHLAAVRLLVCNYEMNPDASGTSNYRAINIAAFHGFHDIVEFLRNHGAKGSSWAKGEWMWPKEEEVNFLVSDDDDEDLSMLHELAAKDERRMMLKVTMV